MCPLWCSLTCKYANSRSGADAATPGSLLGRAVPCRAVCQHLLCANCVYVLCAVLQVLDGLLLRALPAVLFALPFYFLMGLNAAVLQVSS